MAIIFVEREAAPYDKEVAEANIAARRAAEESKGKIFGGCTGSMGVCEKPRLPRLRHDEKKPPLMKLNDSYNTSTL